MRTIEIDRVFDSGHAACDGQLVSLHMCESCAGFLARVLHELSHHFDGLDEECAYYLRAFSADVQAQTTVQVSDVDAEFRAIAGSPSE